MGWMEADAAADACTTSWQESPEQQPECGPRICACALLCHHEPDASDKLLCGTKGSTVTLQT